MVTAEAVAMLTPYEDVVADGLIAVYAPRAVQFHPHGGQFDFARPSARTHHGAYV